MSNLLELEKLSIERFKAFEPDDGYYLAYSGGKDSDVIKILAQLAGVKFEAVHNLTTVDAPETVQYIKSQPDVRIDYPEKSMWRLIVDNGMPPTRFARYCCVNLKEGKGKGKITVTGVRWDESKRRKENAGVIRITNKPKFTQKIADDLGAEYLISKQGGLIMNNDNDQNRHLVEHCYRTSTTMLNPIVDWTNSDVWDFLGYYGCKSNPQYQFGFKRIGCIGCPMAGKHRYTEFRLYPVYYQNYIRAFDRMLAHRKEKGLETDWQSGEEVMKWWLGEDVNQLTFI